VAENFGTDQHSSPKSSQSAHAAINGKNLTGNPGTGI
jgi:hypothetical protein